VTTQIDGLNAKLIEASGALKAKEELREERWGEQKMCIPNSARIAT
jgi:hypothetical protein